MPMMRRRFPIFPACPICGDLAVNPGSLAIVWEWDEAARLVTGTFVAGPRHTGYEKRIHGGLITALLDECMAWACAVDRGTYCVTGDLTVRFRGAAPLGVPLLVSARTAADAWGPYLRATGTVSDPSGRTVATARATFAALPLEDCIRMRQSLRFSAGDIDVLEAVPKP
jgi:acyl-coenzyme A thioesterase PaaI-like protein